MLSDHPALPIFKPNLASVGLGLVASWSVFHISYHETSRNVELGSLLSHLCDLSHQSIARLLHSGFIIFVVGLTTPFHSISEGDLKQEAQNFKRNFEWQCVFMSNSSCAGVSRANSAAANAGVYFHQSSCCFRWRSV